MNEHEIFAHLPRNLANADMDGVRWTELKPRNGLGWSDTKPRNDLEWGEVKPRDEAQAGMRLSRQVS